VGARAHPKRGALRSQGGNGRDRRLRRECDRVLRRILIGLSIALLTAGPAGAGTIVVKLNFAPGKLLARSAPATASDAGAVQVPVTVADGRGNGQGWTLRFAASRPLTVTAITARCAAGSTCTLPRAAQAASGAIVLQAARDTGMGEINLVVTVAPLPPRAPHAAIAFTIS
jgi:hypothetical protein